MSMGYFTISRRASTGLRRRRSPGPGPRRRGPCAALRIGGITVVVVSHRVQCADPVFFEMMGLDIARARSVAVKSRGHFRGGFDRVFAGDRSVAGAVAGVS